MGQLALLDRALRARAEDPRRRLDLRRQVQAPHNPQQFGNKLFGGIMVTGACAPRARVTTRSVPRRARLVLAAALSQSFRRRRLTDRVVLTASGAA